MSLLVVGSVALDTIQTPAGEVEEVLGGSATYFSFSARFFNKPHVVAVVGDDFPKEYVNLMNQHGVNLDGLEFEGGKTFRWSGVYPMDFGDPETLNTELNVFMDFNPKLPESYRDSKYIFLANIDPELQLDVLNQVDEPAIIGADTMNYWIENRRKELLTLLKKIDILFLNELEARMLTGEENLLRAARSIIALGPKHLILKRGQYGVMMLGENSFFVTPAYFLERVVDPTGAGDSFAGAFMGHLARKKKIDDNTYRQAVVYGAITASFTVEDFSVNKLVSIGTNDIESRLALFTQFTECRFP
ncbi:sugar kinase [bacterium]|nr:sugar kinase [bacterium]